MIVLVSLIVLLRGFPCFHDFSHGASLHSYSFIFTLVPHIFLGSHINAAITYAATRVYIKTQLPRICVHAYMHMRSAAPLSGVSLVKWRRSSSHTLDSYSSQLLLLLHILR